MNESWEFMKRLILICLVIGLSLTMISCNNMVSGFLNKEQKVEKKQSRKQINLYFITTSEKQHNEANWVEGESNENSLVIKEKKQEPSISTTEEEKPEEQTVEEPPTQPVQPTQMEQPPLQESVQDNNFIPDPSYDMNDIVPSPDEVAYPEDSTANPNDIIADPYSETNN